MMIFYFSSKFGRFEAGGQGHHTIQKHPTLKGAMFSRAEAIGWLESVTAALDCYNWVFRDQLFSPSELFNGNLSLSLSPSSLPLSFLPLSYHAYSSERKNILASNDIGSPVHTRVLGTPPFVQTPRRSPSTPTIPQSANRPTFPHFSVFPVVPSPPVPAPTRDPAPSSPSTISRRARPAGVPLLHSCHEYLTCSA